jgi:hypothetical protein
MTFDEQTIIARDQGPAQELSDGDGSTDHPRLARINITGAAQLGDSRHFRPTTPTMIRADVVLGNLLGGRSPAERLAFLARPAPAETPASPAEPRSKVVRNYTRRLRDH